MNPTSSVLELPTMNRLFLLALLALCLSGCPGGGGESDTGVSPGLDAAGAPDGAVSDSDTGVQGLDAQAQAADGSTTETDASVEPADAAAAASDAAAASADGGGLGCAERGYCCVRDPARLAQRAECAYDTDCPCGAHCDQGLCASSCASDGDCALGGWCDGFGRCRTALEATTFVGPSKTTEGTFEVSPSAIPVLPYTSDTPVSIAAVGRALGEVRVVASPGVLVSCGAGGFLGECAIPSVALGAPAQVLVRVEATDAGTALPGGVGSVRFFHAKDERGLSLVPQDPNGFVAPAPGVYQGRLWLAGARVNVEGATPFSTKRLAAGLRTFDVPVTVKLYPGGRLVFVETGLTGVIPDGWAFHVAADGTFDAMQGSADLSRRVFLSAGTSGAASATEVVSSGTGVLWSMGSTLAGTLMARLSGFGQTFAPSMLVDERQRGGWQFSTTRVGDIPAGENPPALGGGTAPAFDDVADRLADPLPWQAEVLAAGAFSGATVTEKVQRLLCWDHPSASTALMAAYSGPNSLSSMGDLKCAPAGSAVRATAFPAFTTADRAVALEPRTLLDACIAELERLQAGPPTGASTLALLSNTAAGLPKCVDGPLALAALGVSMDAFARAGAPDMIHWPVATPQAEADARLAQRVLQQWLQVLTLVAREATQESDQFLGTDSAKLAQALSASLSGWTYVLHPRVGSRLVHLPPALLASPDYRGAAVPSDASEDRTQQVGLPLVLLETLRAQFEAATQLIRRARFSGGSLSPEVHRTLKLGGLVAPLSYLLYARTRLEATPSWNDQWIQSQASFDRATAALLREWRAYRAGENPLGITEDDLPLYRGLFNPASAGVRFSAISSFLTANGGWATTAVSDARNAEALAKTAWTKLLERQLQGAIAAADRTARIAEIKSNYAEKVASLCGNPNGYAMDQLLDQWTDLAGSRCFVALNRPECAYDETSVLKRLSMDDLGYQLCVMAQMKNRLGSKVDLSAGYANEWVDQVNKAFMAYDRDDTVASMVPVGPSWWDKLVNDTVGVAGSIFAMQQEAAAGAQGALADLYQLKRVELDPTVDEAALAEATAICQARLPGARNLVDTLADEAAPNSPDCYQGSIGEQVLAARAAAADVDTATRKLQDYLDRYQAAMWRCTIDDKGITLTQSVSDQLTAIEEKTGKVGNLWRDVNEVCKSVSGTVVAGVASVLQVQQGGGGGGSDGAGAGAKDGADSAPAGTPAPAGEEGGGELPEGVVELATGAVNSVFDFGLGWVAQTFDGLSGTGEVRAQHKAFMDDVQSRITDAKCFHDAEMELIGAETASNAAVKSKIDLAQAVLKVRNAQAEVDRLATEGRRRAAAEALRSQTSLFQDVWSDLWAGDKATYQGAVEDYRRKMRLAQRMVYLAARAVEYEWQVTDSRRAQILAATTPSQLESLLTSLRLDVASGNINGQSPANHHAELSFKQHVLQLSSLAGEPAGFHTLTDTQRLRAILSSPAFAHHDKDGNYLGQLVPFSLAPMGVLGLGTPGSIPLLTGSECAERVWSVNASLYGTGLVSDSSTYSRVELIHRNAFYSQWCDEPAAGEPPFERASVRPARNLFKDPEWGGTFGSTNDKDSEYVRALVDAYHNVPTADFQKSDYHNGASEELACRGVYGDWALFFPVQTLGIGGGQGLRLENVDDIVLRLDYVSAAKRW